MAVVTLKGREIQTAGELPVVGEAAPDFTLTQGNLRDITLPDLPQVIRILNIVPSLDTERCSRSARTFQESAPEVGALIINISVDTPMAQDRFCAAEGAGETMMTLSAIRHPEFGDENHYGVNILTGPLRGFLSRAVLVLDADGIVRHSEQVPEISQDPNYEAALAAAQQIAT